MRFREYVDKMEMSLNHASRFFDLNRGTINKIYYEKSFPDPKTIRNIVTKTKWVVTPEDLLDLQRPKTIRKKIVLD
jgi:hypothetical protein